MQSVIIEEVMTHHVVTIPKEMELAGIAYPDETIGDALKRMGSRGLGRLPVVARDARGQGSGWTGAA